MIRHYEFFSEVNLQDILCIEENIDNKIRLALNCVKDSNYSVGRAFRDSQECINLVERFLKLSNRIDRINMGKELYKASHLANEHIFNQRSRAASNLARAALFFETTSVVDYHLAESITRIGKNEHKIHVWGLLSKTDFKDGGLSGSFLDENKVSIYPLLDYLLEAGEDIVLFANARVRLNYVGNDLEFSGGNLHELVDIIYSNVFLMDFLKRLYS